MTTITSTELGATGRYVYFDQAALDDLGSQTILAYCYPTGSGGGGFAYLYAKVPSASVNGPRMFIADNTGAPRLTFGANSNGTATAPLREGAANSAVYNSWGHYAVTWDGSLNYTGIHSYSGVGVNLAEIGYNTQTNGTTSVASDASSSAYLMNRAGLGREFVGDVAYIAVWDRVLSLAELQNAQNNGPLSEPTGLVLLWANQADLSQNALTATGRSAYAAGSLPPNTELGGSPPVVDLAGSAAAVATATGELASSSADLAGDASAVASATGILEGAVDLQGAASATASATADLSVGAVITLSDDFERSSAFVDLSTVSGSGDSAIITIRPRVQESEVVSSQYRWLHPLVKVTGVNGIRPTFRFSRYRPDVDGGYHYTAWDAGRKPMFSYDLETWFYFDTTAVNNTGNILTGYIEFRDNQAFTSDTVYVSKGRVRTVAQCGAWIDNLAAAYPSLIHTVPSTVSGFVSGTYSSQTNENGVAIPAQPFYAFKISDSSLVPEFGEKKTAVFISGVHAGEDQANWAMEAAVEFLLGADPAAQNMRKHFDLYVYPMLNAPGRAGGGWRGSFTQGVGGIDDANRHFSDASPGLEIVTLPRAAMQADLPATVDVAIDFHGAVHEEFGIYLDTGNTYQPLFDAALEPYINTVGDTGESNSGFTTSWFQNTRNTNFAITSELGDPNTLTDAQITAWGEAHVRAISDLYDSGKFGGVLHGVAGAASEATAVLSVGVPLAAAGLSVATATGTLSVSISGLVGVATATADATGGLNLSIPLAAAAVAQALASAGISQEISLGGGAVGVAGADGVLSLNVSLAGNAVAEAAASASLTATNGLSLAGDAQAQASALGTLSHAIPLSSASLAVAGASGNITQLVPLSGSAASASVATGGLDISLQLSGSALAEAFAAAGITSAPAGLEGAGAAEASAGGSVTLRVGLVGDAVARAIAAGALTTSAMIIKSTPGWKVSAPARDWTITASRVAG